MTEEVKTQVDDMKDFAQQVKLEAKKQTRNAEVGITKKVAGAADALGIEHTHNKADIVGLEARTAVLNAGDLAKQAGLEAKIRGRDTKLAFDQSTAGQKINAAAAATAEAAHDATQKVKDAVLPTEKVVEQTSTRGVDITHIENPANDKIPHERAAIAAKQAAEADREKELERQRMLASVKATVAEKTETVGAVLAHVRDEAAVVLGKAAVAAKEAIDGLTQEPKQPQVQSRTSASGVDISSVSNAHNEELLAREQRLKDLEAAKQPTLGDKVTDTLSKAGAAIKGAYVEATTEAPAPILKTKTSDSGIDISSAANPANAQLAAEEQKRLDEQKARELAREKALVADQVKQGIIDPATAKAGETKDDLSSKLSALGESLSAAASKLGTQISEKYQELANPTPLDVHEKKSDNGIDTTSIANANNHVLGEQIKQQQAAGGLGAAIAPTKEEALARAAAGTTAAPTPEAAAAAAVAPDRETAAIKSTLNGGVAVRDTKHELGLTAANAKADLKNGASLLVGDAAAAGRDVKADLKSGASALQQEAHRVGEKISDKIETVTHPADKQRTI